MFAYTNKRRIRYLYAFMQEYFHTYILHSFTTAFTHSLTQQNDIATIWGPGDVSSPISHFPWGCGVTLTYSLVTNLLQKTYPIFLQADCVVRGSVGVPNPLAHSTTSYLVPTGLPFPCPIFGGSYNG